MAYVAEIVASAVSRIIVAPSAEWATTNLGGTWQEVTDPNLSVPARFAYPRIGAASSTVQPPVLGGATVFSSAPQVLIQSAEYTAWPYNNLHYDSTRDKLWLIYTTGAQHTGENKQVEWVEIDRTTLTAGTPVVVSPEIDAPTAEGATCHAAAVLPNDDYLAVVRYTDAANAVTRHEIRRSTDGGATWTDEGMPQKTAGEGGGDIALAAEVGPHGLYVTAAGTLLLSWLDADSEVVYYYRSTDNGATWALITTANPNYPSTTPLEPAFFQHPTSGRILMWHRAGQSGSQPQPIYHYSDDDGATWSVPASAPTHFDMYNNPAAIVYHSDDDLVEMFVASRTSPIGLITQCVATPDNAVAGTWGGRGILFGGSASKDFGYPAACRVGSKVYLTWYNGSSSDTDIYLAVGDRPA